MVGTDRSGSDNLNRAVCRPALPKDFPDVMELTRTIWEGEDYVPSVWADWFSDPHGLLAVAEFGGNVIGLSKLTKLSEQQWWLEGLRVHPNYEGRGIASRLHDYLLEYWKKAGTGMIRLVTASFRKPVHNIALRSGFHRVCELSLFTSPLDDSSTSTSFSMVENGEVAQALGFIQSCPTFRLTQGLIDLGWQWATLDQFFLTELIERGQVWWWRGRSGLLIAREDQENLEKVCMVQLLACNVSDVSACLSEFRHLAFGLGSIRMGWFAPLNPQILPLLDRAGYQRSWDTSLFLFEKESSLASL